MQFAAIQPSPLLGLHTVAVQTVSRSHAGPAFAEGSCRFSRSVVGQAGLGNFIYAHGRSGKRYVFSSIRREQAALYRSAVFATGNLTGGRMSLALNADGLAVETHYLFVHLVEDETEARQVFDDLHGAGWRG